MRAESAEEPWPPATSENEWLLMYLRGLTFAQIERWCRVNAETVRRSICQQLGSRRERGMQRWLHNQRLKLEAGELDPRREELLDALGEYWNK